MKNLFQLVVQTENFIPVYLLQKKVSACIIETNQMLTLIMQIYFYF
jgi:hypothetical protein